MIFLYLLIFQILNTSILYQFFIRSPISYKKFEWRSFTSIQKQGNSLESPAASQTQSLCQRPYYPFSPRKKIKAMCFVIPISLSWII